MAQPVRKIPARLPDLARRPKGELTRYEAMVQKLKGRRATAWRLPSVPPAGSKPRKARPSGESSRVLELRKLSKTKLYDRAKEINLAGRSSMTKDQLVMALAAHEHKQRQNEAAAARNRRTSKSWLGNPLA